MSVEEQPFLPFPGNTAVSVDGIGLVGLRKLVARLSQIPREQAQLRYRMKRAGAFRTHDRLMDRHDALKTEWWEIQRKLSAAWKKEPPL